MSLHNWISRINDQIRQIKEVNLKKKFNFLICMIADNEKNTNEKIHELYKCIEKSNSETIEEFLKINELIINTNNTKYN